MKKIFFTLIFILVGISNAQYLSVSGEWNYTIPSNDISEAGEDFTGTYTSDANQAYIDVWYWRNWRVNIQKNNILDNVKKCWASLFSERAISYYKSQKKKKDLEMAVIIQEMVAAEKSLILKALKRSRFCVLSAAWRMPWAVIASRPP